MQKFIYKKEDDQVHLEMQDMDLTQAAAEIGSITQEIYTALHRQDPSAAGFFKTAIILSVMHPDSTVWKPKEHGEDAVALCIMGRKKPE